MVGSDAVRDGQLDRAAGAFGEGHGDRDGVGFERAARGAADGHGVEGDRAERGAGGFRGGGAGELGGLRWRPDFEPVAGKARGG